jgi:hypothetical protein
MKKSFITENGAFEISSDTESDKVSIQGTHGEMGVLAALLAHYLDLRKQSDDTVPENMWTAAEYLFPVLFKASRQKINEAKPVQS